MLDIIKQYDKDYKLNFFVPTIKYPQNPKNHIGGLPYDKHLSILSRCKMSFNTYFIGSILESVMCGSLPLVWKFELNGIPKSNWPFMKEANEMDCLLCPSDGGKVIKEKVDRLMFDEEYYNKVLECFQISIYDYTFEGSYKIFQKLVDLP
jgi:hypothetical protein